MTTITADTALNIGARDASAATTKKCGLAAPATRQFLSVAPTPDSHPRQWAIFSQLDADGSGTLDIDEVYNYLADMDETVADELMQVLDANNDGEVDFSEFCAGWDNIFSISIHESQHINRQAALSAAVNVQRHFRGFQARRMLVNCALQMSRCALLSLSG